MTSVTNVEQVLEGIQQVKSRASAFCTNFFPAQPKLQAWIRRRELASTGAGGVTFFFRRDRDFKHLYFCAVDPSALERELAALPETKSARLTADLIGPASAISPLIQLLEKAGFSPYKRLLRLARPAEPVSQASTAARVPSADDRAGDRVAQVVFADKADSSEILALIESAFDPRADQLPALDEIETAIADRQILIIRHEAKVAAVLFFETQGFTSVVRYWMVAEPFRSFRFGSALIRHYFQTQHTVRRFILWVAAANENALSKYAHYGYRPDGLLDQVMVNHAIPS